MKRVTGLVAMLLLLLSPAFAQGDIESPEVEVAPLPVESPEGTTESAPGDRPEDGVATENVAEDAPDALSSDTDDSDSTTPTSDNPFVVICPIEGEIDEGIVVVIERAVKEAENAEALLFVINTPGGRVDSAIEITTAIMSVECPTIAYIEGMGAISAGAIISYSCDYLYMAEGTNIGASTPIMPGVETTEAMDEKSNSFVRAKYRALGEANGHAPLLGEAMVDRNMEVRGYRNEDGSYYIFEVEDNVKRNSGSNNSGDMLDKILDAVSEGAAEESGDFSEVLKKILGAAAGVEDNTPRSSDDQEEDDPYTIVSEHTELISARGELLTMTSKEAVHFGLAADITTGVDDTLREFYLGSVDRLTITPTWEEVLFAFLTSPTIAGLLLMAGLGGIYVEVRTPGFGAPGIIGSVCLALFFGSHMVLGMTDWIDIALILAGFLLILAEIFLLPGFGLAGILGFVSLLGGAYLALVKAPIPEFTWEWIHFNEAIYTLTVTIISFVAFVGISGLLLPYSPLGRALMLQTALDVDAGYTAQSQNDVSRSIGLTGVALSALRPSGKGRFGTEKYDIVTRGEFVDEGTAIRIIESSGNRYVVTAIDDEAKA